MRITVEGEAVAGRLGMGVRFRAYPWKRAMKYIREGEAHALMGARKTPERQGFLYFEKHNLLQITARHFFVKSGRENNIRFDGSMASLRRWQIADHRGYRYNEAYLNAPWLKRVSVDSNEQIFAMVLAGGWIWGLPCRHAGCPDII